MRKNLGGNVQNLISQSSKTSLFSPSLDQKVSLSSPDYCAKLPYLVTLLPVISCLYTNKIIVPTGYSDAKNRRLDPVHGEKSCDRGVGLEWVGLFKQP